MLINQDPNELRIAQSGHHAALPVYRYIRDWVHSNAQKRHNFKNGHYWTYNTLATLAKMIPGMTVSKIRTALKHLKKLGVIITGCFNQWACDRTTWYTVADQEQEQVKPEHSSDLSITANEIDNSGSLTREKSLANTNRITQQDKTQYKAAAAARNRARDRAAMITRKITEADFPEDFAAIMSRPRLNKA